MARSKGGSSVIIWGDDHYWNLPELGWVYFWEVLLNEAIVNCGDGVLACVADEDRSNMARLERAEGDHGINGTIVRPELPEGVSSMATGSQRRAKRELALHKSKYCQSGMSLGRGRDSRLRTPAMAAKDHGSWPGHSLMDHIRQMPTFQPRASNKL